MQGNSRLHSPRTHIWWRRELTASLSSVYSPKNYDDERNQRLVERWGRIRHSNMPKMLQVESHGGVFEEETPCSVRDGIPPEPMWQKSRCCRSSSWSPPGVFWRNAVVWHHMPLPQKLHLTSQHFSPPSLASIHVWPSHNILGPPMYVIIKLWLRTKQPATQFKQWLINIQMECYSALSKHQSANNTVKPGFH